MRNTPSFFTGALLFTVASNITNVSHAAKVYSTDESSIVESSFIAQKDAVVIKEIGKCDIPRAPFSTFKVALAVMGFDANILISKDLPLWPYKDEYFEGDYAKKLGPWYTPALAKIYNWLGHQTPATFMKNSVLWFSHQITQRLGGYNFQEYVKRLRYGNEDVSGTPGNDDGLLSSWLGSSLTISPREQMAFIEKLVANKLPVSQEAQEKTRQIMDREENWNGWKLYGKTGSGNAARGWFIGWIEKDGKRVIFAHYLELTGKPPEKSVGLVAKEIARKYLAAKIPELSIESLPCIIGAVANHKEH